MKRIKRYGLIFFLIYAFCYFGHCEVGKANESNKQLVVKVGVYNDPPLICNKNRKPEGICIDIIENFAENENLKIEYIHAGFDQLFNMLETGDIDILPDIAFTEKRDSIFFFNEIPILTTWNEIYTTKQAEIHSISDLNSKKIGVLKNSVEQKYLENNLKYDYSLNFETYECSDYLQATNLLKNNQIDALIAGRFFHFSKETDNEVLHTGLIFCPYDIRFAFTRESDNYLVELFDHNISKLLNDPNSIYYKSISYWLRTFYANIMPSYILWIIASVIFIWILVLSFTAFLKHQVKVKTKSLLLNNRALIKATEAAQESDKLKTAFLLNISHEIRTPMNGILGFMSLLEKRDLDKEVRHEYIEIVNQSGQRLLNTVDDIIEISMIESGQYEMYFDKVNIKDLLQFQNNFLQQQAIEKGLQLHFSKDSLDEDNFIIETDPRRLEGILTNLLNNALKFTKKGSIEFGYYREVGTVVFFIKDTGIGIPNNCQESIFKRFVQVDNKETRAYEGCGLGLALAKANIEALQGKIWVKSEESKGSTFFFSLPYLPENKEIT